jgi:mannose-6-phosphate isomerase-like protein (cupin superfamily)
MQREQKTMSKKIELHEKIWMHAFYDRDYRSDQAKRMKIFDDVVEFLISTTLLSENERTRVWIIRLAPGERLGFHHHVLDYFWTAISGSRARVHVQDGTTVEYTYQPNETRHGRLGKGEFTVHDLENIGDDEMVFVTVEFKDSANKAMVLPSGVTSQ